VPVSPELRTPTHLALRASALDRVDQARPQLEQLAQALHANPEISFHEVRSVARIAELLRAEGLSVDVGTYDLATSFETTVGDDPFTIVICAEYDALPGIGQACGHNIIAAGSIGAMLAVAPIAQELGVRVVLLGTPAEEHGTGKQIMLERGAWDDATVSMMVHPISVQDYWPDAVERSAVHRLTATFTGLAAHAASGPQYGKNAADAATLTLVALGLLRQQVADGMRFNAIVREGGTATNIIPATAVVDFEVRGPTVESQQELEQRVIACFEGAAIATGCGFEYIEAELLYEQVEHDAGMVELFGDAMLELGRTVSPRDAHVPGGSTDMGNVSRYLPSIHPTMCILGSVGPAHSITFAAASGTAAAMDAAIDSAKAMALTIVDLAHDEDARAAYLQLQSERPAYAQLARAAAAQ